MKNHHPRFFKLLRISCLLLLCTSFSGCLLSSHFACGRAAPLPDGQNLLTIEQRYDFVKHEKLAGRICYDETGFYFLRGSVSHMSICRAVKPGDCEILYTPFYEADEIACWGDKLVILGQLDLENYRNDLFVLDKANPVQSSLRVYPYKPEKTIKMPDGSEWHIYAWLPLLRLVFNKETSNVSFETLFAQQVGYSSDYSLSKERWEYLFHVIGQSIEGEYTILRLQDRYVMKVGSWIYSFRHKEKENKYEMRNSYFIPDSTKGSEEIPYSSDPYYDLCMYDSFPYFINTDYTDYRDDYSPTYVQPAAESGKFGRVLDAGEGYFLRKRYPGEQGRMQYLVFTLYDQEPTQNYNDKYDLQFLTGHKILAVDLETMQQTNEMALSMPREQVLYVNAAGAYTWRQEESRVFFTSWEGEPVAVSDVIPYVPRYETPQDEEQNDACNVWYAEVDAERDRLLLFDMTQGETALLAVVPLAY